MERKDFVPPLPTNAKKAVLNGEWKGSLTYAIDKISKKLATEFTPVQYREEKPLTQIHSILYWLDKNNPDGPVPQDPTEDGQFSLWEYPVRLWVASRGIREETIKDIPAQFDDIHRPEYAPKAFFASPPPSEASYSGSLSFAVSASGRYPIGQIDVLFGNRFVSSAKNPPYSFFMDLSKIKDLQPQEILVVKIYDIYGNSSSLEKEITLK